jgi:hypothetical protein
LWFTHDCPSRRSDAARSFRGSETCGCGTQKCEQSPHHPVTSGKKGIAKWRNCGLVSLGSVAAETRCATHRRRDSRSAAEAHKHEIGIHLTPPLI